MTALETQPARLVIDDLDPLLRELGPRAHDYMSALVVQLHGANVTNLFLREIAPFNGFHLELVDTPLGVIGENVLLLQQHEQAGVLHRILAVLRMRFSAYDQTLREIVISAEGVRVLGLGETQSGILASAAIHGPPPTRSARRKRGR